MATELSEEERVRDLAAAVLWARGLSKMTQTAAIAKAAKDPTTKVGKTRWVDVENGALPLPDVSIIGRMAEVLDVDPNVLLAAAGFEPPSVPVEVRQLVDSVAGRLEAIETRLQRMDADVKNLRSRSVDRSGPATTRREARSL